MASSPPAAHGDARPRLLALPDGSVDRVYDVSHGGERVATRAALAGTVADGRSAALALHRRATEPGGHAVNVAEQAHLLGAGVELVGLLDHPAFAGLPFATASTGAPSRVAVYEFDDGAVLAAEPSPDAATWSLSDVARATGRPAPATFATDAVVWTNWTDFPRVPAALARLAGAGASGGWFVLDPGDVAGRDSAAVAALFHALAALGEGFDVVLAANDAEVRHLAAALARADVTPFGAGGEAAGASESMGVASDGAEPDDATSDAVESGDVASGAESRAAGADPAGGPTDPAAVDAERALGRLRDAGDLAAAVLHEAEVAAAATPSGRVRVEPPDVEPVRHTGGGDRFDAGLAYALATGRSWREALRLGNACASYYVATGSSARRSDVADALGIPADDPRAAAPAGGSPR